MRRLSWSVAALVVVILGAGCESSDRRASPDSGNSHSPSPEEEGRLLVSLTTKPGGFKASISGKIGTSETGCISLDGIPIVAPPGSSYRDGVIKIPGYPDLRIGDSAKFAGGLSQVNEAEVPKSDSCAPEDGNFVLVT